MAAQQQYPSLKSAQLRSFQPRPVQRSLFSLSPEQQELGKGGTYLIKTYGCQANQRDTETLIGILEAMGYTPAQQAEQADVILLNTCAIRQNAENKVFGEIGNLKALKQHRPDVILGVCGCMAQEEATVAAVQAKYPQVDLVFGTHNLHRLPTLIEQAKQAVTLTVEVFSEQGDVIEDLPVSRIGQVKAWVNIMYGCDKFCTYCIVPYTRGKERSRLPEDVIAEIRQLQADGYKEVTLLGQNVNAYGKDRQQPEGFANLLEMTALTGIERIRFMTSHPWDFTDQLLEVITAYPNIMPAIHLPVQSGNDDVLKRMGRRYTRASYLELTAKIRKVLPQVTITTDIIVGFPQESDAQFADTLSLAEQCRFDGAFTFIYSPRTGTPAAQMADDIPLSVKQARLQQLNDLVTASSLASHQARVGSTLTVLVEGPSKKNPRVLSGYTEQNQLVNFAGSADLAGQLVEVEITGAKSWFLLGQLVMDNPADSCQEYQ